MRFFLITTLLLLCNCSVKVEKTPPSWYISPTANNSQNLYGVAEGFTLEEATRYALADAATRLAVSISSESSLLREEDQRGTNEEMRQQIKQNVEKIDFGNFQVSNSSKVGEKFFVEVEIDRTTFIRQQQEQIEFLETQINNLAKDLAEKNTIQKRNNLIKALDLSRESELRTHILQGSGLNLDLKEKLARTANFKDQLNRLSDKIEFYFTHDSPNEIVKIIGKALNKEKIKLVKNHDAKNPNEITLDINSHNRSSNIYGSFITKIEINFNNSVDGKIIASNNIESSGSSVISEKESYSAALKNLEEKIKQDGVLETVGILAD